MSKFKQILSYGDYFELHEEYNGSVFNTIYKTEQAVLAKLAEQEPVATVSQETFSNDGTSDIIASNLPIGTPLYAHPFAPPMNNKTFCVSEIAESDTQTGGQGIFDSSNHIPDAKKMVVPEGWQLVPTEPTEEMKKSGGHINSEWLNDFAPAGEKRYAIPMEGVYKSMLAAAPKYTEGK